ncbi:MAG: hypothetical protein E7048_02970 [Lentisphaerae bacterium]|nr:hypothetical protein [Lentisphaerota bacterium]
MKTFFFFLTAVFCLVQLQGADVFTSGGIETDWSKYQTRDEAEVKSTINFVRNGSFEKPVNFGERKSIWRAQTRTHGMKKTPEALAFQARFAKAGTRKITQISAADGKSCILIKTPDEVKEWFKPFPQISNRLIQKVPVQVNEEGTFRLSFKAKGYHTPTAPNRGLFLVQVTPVGFVQKSRSRKNMRYGIQRFFSLRSEWSTHNFDFSLPAGCKAANVTLSLYGAGEACLDDVRLFPVKFTGDPLQVRLMPYALLDNTFCLGEKLPGVMNFAFNSPDKKFKAKKMTLELRLPEGFKITDVRQNCTLVSKGKGVWEIGLTRLLPAALKRPWYVQHGCSVMVESTLPASGKLYALRYRLKDGKWQGRENTVYLKVIPAVQGNRPEKFRSSAMLNNEWSFEKAGVEKIADFYMTSGFSAIFGAKGPVSKAMKARKIHRYLQNSHLANGFRLGEGEKPEFAQFKMVDGKPYSRKVCPVEVYTRGPYYMEAVYNKLLKSLIADQDLTDSFMPNWEPYYLDSKGCFCNRCREEFVKYYAKQIPKEEVMKVWPGELLQKYAEEYFAFRSWQHGKLIETLHKDVTAIGKSVGKESFFIPELSWKCGTHKHNYYCKQYNIKEFMHKLPWLELWGPYIYHRAGQIYDYFPTRHLVTYNAAGMMKEFFRDHSAKGPVARLIAFPHGYQSNDWVTEPEALAFETLSFFVWGFEGVFCYYFPRGYDYRHWAAMARTNTLIARYENFIFEGKNDNKGVSVLPLTPGPEKLFYPPGAEEPAGGSGNFPGLSKMKILQFQVWRKNNEMLICTGNFWQKGEHFFKLSIAGLEPGKKYGVEVSGKGYGNFTGRELAQGIVMQTGALRWQFIRVGASAVNEEVSQSSLRKLMESRLPLIRKAVEWEKAHYKKVSAYTAADNPKVDYNALKKVTSAGVTVAPGKRSLQISTANYTLTLEPSQGGRIHNWKCGSDVMIGKRPRWGYAVPAVWYPADAALMLRSGMKLEWIKKTDKGVSVKLSRVISAKDNSRLAGNKLELTHSFAPSSVVTTLRFTNLSHDGVEFAFRYHNMSSLLSRQKRQTGEVLFASGERFPRSYVQKFIRTSAPDPLLEKAYKRTKHISTAREFPVVLQAPWSKNALKFSFAPRPHSIMVWDEEKMDCSTFEPVYPRVQLAPGTSAEFTMSAEIVKSSK